jgi:C1A family cysteine protease
MEYFAVDPPSRKHWVLFLGTLCVVGVVVYCSGNTPMEQRLYEEESEFKGWMLKHGKLYVSEQEFFHRFSIFRENLAFIRIQNRQGNSYSLGTNQFTDLTHEEFRELVSRPMPDMPQGVQEDLSYVDVATTVDWRQRGGVTNVKNQGHCGSCWSFSAAGALEGSYFNATGVLVSLSEQQLVDCSWPYHNTGCGGGWMNYAFEYAKKNPLVTEADYPYTAQMHNCTYNSSLGVVRVSSYVGVRHSDSALAAALNLSPVSVAIEADQMVFQHYCHGVINYEDCGANLNHGVLAVGYTEDYWIVKNSWGASWGDQGFVKLQRNNTSIRGTCGILGAASYPVVEV